jgi:5-methylcytosine-specific restriction enzyme B
MSYADQVRKHCRQHYVEPARAAGQKEISIHAGDVHQALGFQNRFPLVCSAIGAAAFSEENRVRRIALEGPLNGSNTVFRFALL